VTVVILPSRSYKKKELEVVAEMAKRHQAICYVNITHSFDALLKEFKKNNIDEKKFLFIDAISPETHHDNCIHVGSPQALTQLSLAIKKSLGTGKFDSLVFDSLSGLCAYNKLASLTRFIHDLFSELKKSGISSVFTMQAGTDKNLLGDVSMFADHVIEVT
jgi:hypothetical protein